MRISATARVDRLRRCWTIQEIGPGFDTRPRKQTYNKKEKEPLRLGYLLTTKNYLITGFDELVLQLE